MKFKATGNEEVKYNGKFFEVVAKEFQAGDTKRVWEQVRRAPGTRLIIVKDGKIRHNGKTE